MGTITKTRTLRPSSREKESPYRVHVDDVSVDDSLIVIIYHEDNLESELFRFRFNGTDLEEKNSIHFRAVEKDGGWDIVWSKNLNPIQV